MARVTGPRLLNLYVDPTPSRPGIEQVAVALYALQVQASQEEIAQVAESPLAGCLVALVKHLAAANGSYAAVETAPLLGDGQGLDPG